MTAQDLKTATLCLQTAHFAGKRGKPMPTLEHGRDLLAELGRPSSITEEADLERLNEGAVVRDDEGYVCERMAGLWYATRSTRPREPRLPAWVLDAGEGA